MTASHNRRNEWLPLGLLCVLAIASDLSFAGLTPLVVAYDQVLHFDLTTAGFLATAEGAGLTTGSLLAVLSARLGLPTRRRVVVTLLVLAGAQLLSAFALHPWALAACRAVSGLAAGLIYSYGMPSIAGSRDPERGFALYFGATFAAGLLGLIIIPSILAWGSLRGFYLVYASLLLACIALIRWYPLPNVRRAESHLATDGAPAIAHSGWRNGSLLSSLFLNFIFNGGLWVLAEHFGLMIPGTDAQSLGALLAGTMLFGLAGTALATIVASRWPPILTIVVGNLGLVAAVLIMSGWHTVVGLILAMAFLNVSVTFLTPATLAALATKSLRGPQWGNLACQAGYSVGPVVIAAITARSGINSLTAVSAAAFVGSAGLAWLALADSPARQQAVGR